MKQKGIIQYGASSIRLSLYIVIEAMLFAYGL
jgi:hypothetical protein